MKKSSKADNNNNFDNSNNNMENNATTLVQEKNAVIAQEKKRESSSNPPSSEPVPLTIGKTMENTSKSNNSTNERDRDAATGISKTITGSRTSSGSKDKQLQNKTDQNHDYESVNNNSNIMEAKQTLPGAKETSSTVSFTSTSTTTGSASAGAGAGVSKSSTSRRQRNSLALRKNIPLNFTFGLTHSSMNSSDLYDDTHDLEAFGDSAEGSSLSSKSRSLMGGSSRRQKASQKGAGRGGGEGGVSGSKTTSSIASARGHRRPTLLRKTCLNPKLSLRAQLMLSFGFVSIIIISFVVVICIVVTILSGQKVNSITLETFDDMAKNIEGTTARYSAEFLTYRLIPSDLVQIIWETTRDRIAGYPNAPGFEEDAHVPFYDMESKSNRYPIVAEPLPLDWQINDRANVNNENYREHVQDRWHWYQVEHNNGYGIQPNGTVPWLSTKSAAYFMQGMCDPNVTDPQSPTYYPGCTDDNNNLLTGGVVAPTDTNQALHRKSSDLGPVLKALYEYHHDVKSLGIAFANDGAGSTIQFPHHLLFSNAEYISEGCQWMLRANPYVPSQPIGTPAMIDRCHPSGTKVSYREYNPLEQGWCRKQALEPDKVHIEGPHLDYASWQGLEEYRWVMTIGRSIYDRVTKEFIGCIRVDVVLDFLEKVLRNACVTDNSHITVVRCDNAGTVVASSARNMTSANSTVTIDQLDVGMTKGNFLELKNLVDYDGSWDPADLRKRYETFVRTHDGFLVGAYPVPPPPESYDPDYRPEFFAVKSISKEDVFRELYVSEGTVDDKVDELVRWTLFIGLIGVLVILVVVCIVSNQLTSPLNFMNTVANSIVDNYVNNSEDGIEFSQPKYASWCTLKTEVSEVVSEFQKMVTRFSGSSNAKAMKGCFTEIKNRFELSAEFAELYASRQDKEFKFKIDEPRSDNNLAEHNNEAGAERSCPGRKHRGTILHLRGSSSHSLEVEQSPSERSLNFDSTNKGHWYLSPLFFWIVFLIAIPLILTTVALSAIVTYRVSNEFPGLVENAKRDYANLELFALQVYVVLRANLVSEVTSRSTRDLHLVTRYTSWLLFDGITRADSFTEFISGNEECKTNSSGCKFVRNAPCDCDWHEATFTEVCHDYDIDTRYLQKQLFSCESHDTMADGDRKSTSYPNVSYSPATTAWWDDVHSVPGFEKGSNASGYDTTYDRLRVLSALPMSQPLYNYDAEKIYVEAVSIGMEEDGMFTGYFGCNPMVFFPAWNSTKENGAPDLRPELCPEGKHGYDPRCREWYHTGRTLYLENGTSFYLTSPYLYGSGMFAQSATAPLVDPKTKRHVGQALVDFRSTPIFGALKTENTPLVTGGFPVLITPLQDNFGGDTVIGPGFSNSEDSDGTARSIEEVVVSSQQPSCLDQECAGKKEFRDTVRKMKRGESGISMFPLTLSDGSVGSMHIAYAPVKILALSVKDSSNFSRGVDATEHLIYSLAFAESEKEILAPFQAIEDDIDHQRNIALAILCTAIVLSAILVLYISSSVAASITIPMLYLLELIRHINRLTVDDMTSSSPEIDRDFGCREVRHVATTMEVLYKVVRDANVAFFSGDIETAHAVLTDTLRLFIRLDNKKAIGVGNNNLGNMMLTMYRVMQRTKEERICGFTEKEIVQKGVAYFHQAIQSGEAAYDKFYETEGWSPNCLEFMQHLSNRYFNRAIFLLTVKNSHKNPKELEELGFRDLQIVTDMDVEIVDEGSQVGWDVRTIDQLFDVKLTRIKGHIQLLEMGYPDDWEVIELLEDALKILATEVKKAPSSSKLFRELNVAGRMQQVETEMMRYLMLKKDIEPAAKIAIRILVEDEFTLPEAQTKAVEVLLAYVKSPQSRIMDLGVRQQLVHYHMWLSAMEEQNDLCRSSSDGPDMDEVSEIFQLSTAKFSNGIKASDKRSKQNSLRESTRGDFIMEIF